jgi:hypothetical protein
MSRTHWADALIADDQRHLQGAQNEVEEDTRSAVLAAYTAALKAPGAMRRHAFDVALRTYRMRHPAVSEVKARRRVAQIVCFCQ